MTVPAPCALAGNPPISVENGSAARKHGTGHSLCKMGDFAMGSNAASGFLQGTLCAALENARLRACAKVFAQNSFDLNELYRGPCGRLVSR